jgi:hypothetical protein
LQLVIADSPVLMTGVLSATLLWNFHYHWYYHLVSWLTDDYLVQQVPHAFHVQMVKVFHEMLVHNFWLLLKWH